MLEVFALPYLAVTGVIGWAVFEPFFRANDAEGLSCSNITISDLLAAPIPVTFVFVIAGWALPGDGRSFWVQALVFVGALAFAAGCLAVGLFLVPQKLPLTFPKRMAIVGFIAPSGTLLVVGWVGFAGWACFYSVAYLAPCMILIAAATFGLRKLAQWVCQVT